MQYLLPGGPMQTTASFAALATGTSIKTLLQAKLFNLGKIIAWGMSFDGFAAALPGKVELIETDVAATVTASADADITRCNDYADIAVPSIAGFTLSTTGTGYNASGEGTITVVRNLEAPQFLPPTAPFYIQYPLGQEPVIQIGKFARIRVLFGTGVNCYPWMKIEI